MRVEIYGDASRKTVSGPTVQFTADDAAPVTDLKAQITPSIAGHSSVTITANGQNTSVSLTKPVYGGAVDVTTGVVTETHGGGAYNPTEVPTDLSSKIVSATTARSASGSVASFNCSLGEYPMSALTAAINPVQDLHGYSSPWPAGGGVNKYPNCVINGSQNGLIVSHDAGNERYNISAGTVSGYAQIISGETFTLSAGTYYWHVDYSSGSVLAGLDPQLRSTDGSTTYATPNTRFTLSADTELKSRITCLADVTIPSNFSVRLAIVSGSTAPTLWTPYSNICPISGWTGLSAYRTGKNLLPPQEITGGMSNVQVSSNGDKVTIDGTASAYGQPVSANTLTLDAGTYYLKVFVVSGSFTNGSVQYQLRSVDGSTTYVATTVGVKFTLQERTELKPRITYTSGTVISNYIIQAMIVSGSTAPTTYEPYQGTTYAVDWTSQAGTVYGGSLDVVNGVLTVGWEIVDLASLTWSATSWGGWRSNIIPGLKEIPAADNANLVAEKYKSVSRSDLQTSPNSISTGLAASPKQLFVNATDSPTGSCVYPLASPITYTLTPQQIATLTGQNNVWSDTGDVTVSYRDGLLSNVSGIMTNSTALTTGENITYTLSQERTFQIPGTVIRTVVGNNVMSASTGNISVTWSSHWFDITPWIAYQGLTFSRNDVDSPDAGRDMSGYMHRGRVGVKEKMNITTVQLTRAQSSTLQTLLYPETIQVRVTPYPRTNTSHTMSMYTNNVKTTYVIHRENGEDLQSLTFPLIEN